MNGVFHLETKWEATGISKSSYLYVCLLDESRLFTLLFLQLFGQSKPTVDARMGVGAWLG